MNFTYKTQENQRLCTNRLPSFSYVYMEKALFLYGTYAICQPLDFDMTAKPHFNPITPGIYKMAKHRFKILQQMLQGF